MTRPLHTVRTTRRPDRVIEVDDATLLDLTRRGQLLPVEPEPDAGADEQVTPSPADAAVTPPHDDAPAPGKRLTPRGRRTTDQQ